jgi:hypothetical protein
MQEKFLFVLISECMFTMCTKYWTATKSLLSPLLSNLLFLSPLSYESRYKYLFTKEELLELFPPSDLLS